MKAEAVVLITIDGCHPDILYELIESGEAPALAEITSGGIFYKDAVTIFPSDTLPGQTTIVTGNYPKNSWIKHNVNFYRTSGDLTFRQYTNELWDASRVYGYDPYHLFPPRIMPRWKGGYLVNNDMNPDIKTIYEVLAGEGLRSAVMMNQISRGATEYFPPPRKASIQFLFYDRVTRQKKYGLLTKAMMDITISNLEQTGMPHLLYIYFGENDAQSHNHGVNTQRYFIKEVIGKQLRRLLTQLRRMKLADRVNWVITADHSQASTEKKGTTFIYSEQIEKVLSKKKVCANKFQPDADILLLHGVSPLLFIKNSHTGRWQHAPDFEEDILPVAENLLRDCKTDTGERCLDFIIACNAGSDEHVVLELEGQNLNSKPANDFFKDKKRKYPLSAERLKGLGGYEAADLILLSDYEKDIVFCIHQEKGVHGSLSASDSLIPVIFAGPDANGKPVDGARLVDVAPTIASLFGMKLPTADGKPLL